MKYIIPLLLMLTSCTSTKEVTTEVSTRDSIQFISLIQHDSILEFESGVYSKEIERILSEATTIVAQPNDTCDTPPKYYRLSAGGDSIIVFGVVKNFQWKKKARESVTERSNTNTSKVKESSSINEKTAETDVSESAEKEHIKEIRIEPNFFVYLAKYWWMLAVMFGLGFFVCWRVK